MFIGVDNLCYLKNVQDVAFLLTDWRQPAGSLKFTTTTTQKHKTESTQELHQVVARNAQGEMESGPSTLPEGQAA